MFAIKWRPRRSDCVISQMLQRGQWGEAELCLIIRLKAQPTHNADFVLDLETWTEQNDAVA